jgi:hypothetical protein
METNLANNILETHKLLYTIHNFFNQNLFDFNNRTCSIRSSILDGII